MRTKELFKFIQERHRIYERRQKGLPKPWTTDPILQQYRFCNVYRELDTVTQWIAQNWRDNHAADPDLWFAMVVARLVNWPESLEDLEFAVWKANKVYWNPERFVKELGQRKADGKKVFTGAYMIHAGPETGQGKPGYLAKEVLSPMWERRKELRPPIHGTLESFHTRLMTCKDMGSFMAGQVVADIKYVGALRFSDDWWTWAAMGPGSQRGLNRVLGRDVKGTWLQEAWLAKLQELSYELAPMMAKAGMPVLHNQDLQNCLCEFDKWSRVANGEGTPRSKYPGA